MLWALRDVAGRVEHAHRGDAGLQGVHRVAGLGQALDQVVELVLDAAMVAELVVEVGQLALRRQVALEQQPGGFLEAAFAGQGLDGDAAIFQAGVLPSMKLTADSATGTSARPGRNSIWLIERFPSTFGRDR